MFFVSLQTLLDQCSPYVQIALFYRKRRFERSKRSSDPMRPLIISYQDLGPVAAEAASERPRDSAVLLFTSGGISVGLLTPGSGRHGE